MNYELALIQLARRKNPQAIAWLRSRYPLERLECQICNQPLEYGDPKILREHALQHLKEHNLLPFI